MDKQAFKQRMQNLKSYRENNPGKGYWDWRNSLPDNLKYTDDTEYNMRGAYESGAQPILENDGFYHLPTRNPQTGEILKTSLHPTFWKGLAEDAKIGYNTYFVGDKVYTKSKEEGPINVYADGGEVGNPSVQAIQQKQWLNDWLKSRSKQMAENIDFYSNQNVYGSSMDRMHVSPFFFQDKEKNAAKIIQEQLQYANNIPIYDYIDVEDAMYNCDFNIKVNKDPLYSPKLTDKELNALLSYRRGEYFTDEEMYKYMNELIIRLHKEEIYNNESDATVSDT